MFLERKFMSSDERRALLAKAGPLVISRIDGARMILTIDPLGRRIDDVRLG